MNQKVFFSILQSVLWGTPAEVPADADWKSVLNLSARQSCLHAFGIWLKSNHIDCSYTAHLQLAMFQTLQRQARLNHFTADVINLLSQHHIPATLIKGYSLSALYPDPDMRQFGDVDIYVGEEHYHRAAEIITNAYPDAHWHSNIRGGIHYSLVLDENLDRVVELHRVTMEFSDAYANQLYQDFTHRYLDHSSCSIDVYGTRVCVPPAAYNALYVFMHAWHHFESTGVGFRQLGDWALCLQHAHKQLSPEEWTALVEEYDQLLKALKMKTVWQTFGHVLVDALGLPAEAFPLYTTRYQKRAKRLLCQLLRDGHGGRPSTTQPSSTAILMSRFPFERPDKHRILQVGYTFCRLIFDAIQMAKFFPDQAWHEFKGNFCKATHKNS